ncbi:unnamed protein product [Lasius platythorax]|uniref:Uncharacterized protein n=2 Tax=Lasius platythorax TaxID=488582 RepID=A0AAV2NZ64_9HYME
MIIVVLCIFALSRGHDAIASSHIEDVIVRFIVNATPVLFPPTRVSLQLCIDYDNTIKLSKILSSNRLMHSIRNFYEEFDSRIYNNLEHRNLYVLNLDCDYAPHVLRQANLKKMFVAPTKWLLLQDRNKSIDNNDNTKLASTYNSILEIFEDLTVYADSDVVLARKFDGDFLQLMSVYRPSPQRGVIWENRGNWTVKNGLRMKTFDVASARRRNLQQTALKSALVMTDLNTINHLTDFEDKSIDPVTKAGYPWILHLAKRMNATISFEIIDSWGYRIENGSWSGMIGMLERREIDIGGTATFLVSERLGVVQYIQLYTQTSSRFIFRRPLLSTVSNIFTLPFQRNVWIAIGVFLILVFCLLSLSIKWEYHQDIKMTKSAVYWKQLNPSKPTASDNLLNLLGAFTQQGSAYEPFRVSSRIVILMLLLASLSLYAAYTANIVGLLQSTTDSIKTLPDLFNSPLKLGAQDVVYNRHYFKSFQDPVRKEIVEQQIEPKGRKSNWMPIEEGVHRIKNELFAFHGEIGSIYQLIEDTYQEEEKCGLTEIDFLKVLYPLLVIQIQSPYLEIIKNGALKLGEYGLKYREEYRLYTRKPVCSSQTTSFTTIGVTECYFALVIMGYGILFAAIIFALELLWHIKQNARATKKTSDAKNIDCSD